MIDFEVYNEAGDLIDKGSTSVKNIGYITMPLAANNMRIVLKRSDAPPRLRVA